MTRKEQALVNLESIARECFSRRSHKFSTISYRHQINKLFDALQEWIGALEEEDARE
jgi:hypothetical protein